MLKEEYIYVFYGMHYLLKWWKDASGFASELSCFYLSLLAFVVGLFFSFSVLWVCGLASLCVEAIKYVSSTIETAILSK